MYEKHFGLKTKPFSMTAEGAAVFVGPRQTIIMKSVNNGLAAIDSVVVVTGPVGVGKTTIVKRALKSTSPGRLFAWIGRIALAPDEVLELLLAGFGINHEATGTIERFSAFRGMLAERNANGARVAIVVEDAQRLGSDALAELEALTAADSGDATGANIILMGQPELNDWLATPGLARLCQRTRFRQSVEPFSAPEVQGYVRNSMRVAGGDFDNIFEGGTVDMLHRYSEGIPRIINNLCESGLTMAVEEGTGRVTVEYIRRLAKDALGIDVEPQPVSAPAPEPVPDDPETPEATRNTPAETANAETPGIESTRPEKRPDWMIDSGVIDADAPVESGPAQEDAETKFEIAPMITVDKHTNTFLTLDPEDVPAAPADQSPSDPKPKPEVEPQLAQVREPEPQAAMEPEAKPADAPLIPDMDVLELAINEAHMGDVDERPVVDPAGDKVPDAREATTGGIPTLTLDMSLENKRKNVVSPDVAKKLSEAKSLDELDDQTAQTLFGDEELDAIADETRARK